MKKFNKQTKGFTLIEILVVIGIIAILAAIVIIAINPARQFAQARNSQRESNVNAILNAIGQNIADNKGIFTCSGTAYSIATASTTIKYGASGADLATCLTPTYLPVLPFDPGNTTVFSTAPHYNSDTDYDTGYDVIRDNTTQRISVCAPGAKEPAISGSNTICVTR